MLLKRFFSLLLALLMLTSSITYAYAHGSQREHDDELFLVLFGTEKTLTPKQQKIFQNIADAVALVIDQFSSNPTIKSKKGLFDELNQAIGFSFRFEDIELQKLKGVINASATNHRRPTHRGWDFPLSGLSDVTPEFWTLRRKILTATVNKELFGQSTSVLSRLPFIGNRVDSESACNDQCEAFCKLVYYVHILGDYAEADHYSPEFQQLIPLTRHEDSTPGLIDELLTLIPVLFKGQRNLYSGLTYELEKRQSAAERMLSATGGLRTQERFDEYRACAMEVFDLLKAQIPQLLKKTDFFYNAFYR